MESTVKLNTKASLKEAWENLRTSDPQLRIRDAARKLGVSEAVLLSADLGETCVRLREDWADILLSFRDLGKVMALTRSEGCVLEHKGNFQKISIHGEVPNQIATVIGPIEQRVFFSAWKFGFAVTNESPRGTMRSFQFFDKAGDAIMKVYLQEKSNMEVFYQLIEEFKHKNQEASIETEAFMSPEYAQKIDLEAFTKDWENMKDTHDFFGMLKKYRIHRLDALKWIGDKWAYRIDRLAARKILEVAAKEAMPIMIFAGNNGNIQIHQGKVRTVRQIGNWLNVMDPEFNMHLNEETVDSAWVVHKNTADGLVSSVELFDRTGEIVARFFGLRKPGLPQNEQWKKLIDSL